MSSEGLRGEDDGMKPLPNTPEFREALRTMMRMADPWVTRHSSYFVDTHCCACYCSRISEHKPDCKFIMKKQMIMEALRESNAPEE